MYYFAYGSNLCTGRLRRRVSSARPLFLAKLERHRLEFHKRSRDDSGKANAFETGQQSDVVHGVVFELDANEKTALDHAEGFRQGYAEKTVVLKDCEGREYAPSMYVGEASHIDAQLRPYSWYKRFVVEGAHQHGLPAEYIAHLEALVAVEDPDRERDARKRKIQC